MRSKLFYYLKCVCERKVTAIRSPSDHTVFFFECLVCGLSTTAQISKRDAEQLDKAIKDKGADK